jgi:hypothetical protein
MGHESNSRHCSPASPSNRHMREGLQVFGYSPISVNRPWDSMRCIVVSTAFERQRRQLNDSSRQ